MYPLLLLNIGDLSPVFIVEASGTLPGSTDVIESQVVLRDMITIRLHESKIVFIAVDEDPHERLLSLLSYR